MLAVVVTSLTAASCATTMTVSSHVERGLDFSTYRSFEWGPPDALPTGDPRLDQNPFFKDHVQGAVEKQLALRGIELSTSGRPDLLIHYHANIQKRLDVNRVDRTYGYCSGGTCPPETPEYEAGTLVLDVIDVNGNRLIWRGWAQNNVAGMLDDSDKMAETIGESVRRMLQRFPRTISSEGR
jgi:hypothetical protein